MYNRIPQRYMNPRYQIMLKIRAQENLKFNISGSMTFKSPPSSHTNNKPLLNPARSIDLLPRGRTRRTLHLGKKTYLVGKSSKLKIRSKSLHVKTLRCTTYHSSNQCPFPKWPQNNYQQRTGKKKRLTCCRMRTPASAIYQSTI